jgi:PAS domain S-box-containing protein
MTSQTSLLREAEQELQLLEETVGTLSQGILIAGAETPDHPVRYVNKAFEELTGVSGDSLLGRGLSVLSQSVTEGFPLELVRTVLREGRAVEAEWRRVRPDGHGCWLGMTLKPIRDEHARTTSLLIVFTDQTERKRLEEQLRLAQKLQTAGRLAGQFAHDFNNLLTAILCHSEMILRTSLHDGAVHENLLRILDAGGRAERLARNLIHLGGDRPRVADSLDLNPVVEETLRLLHGEIGEGIEFSLALDATAPLRAAPGQVQHLLASLLLLTRDALTHGGVLSVQTCDVLLNQADSTGHAAASQHWFVQLEVSGSTCGTPRSRGTLPNGAGFSSPEGGMAVVRELAAEIGGVVEVDSRIGFGDTIRVLFPRAARPMTLAGVLE